MNVFSRADSQIFPSPLTKESRSSACLPTSAVFSADRGPGPPNVGVHPCAPSALPCSLTFRRTLVPKNLLIPLTRTTFKLRAFPPQLAVSADRGPGLLNVGVYPCAPSAPPCWPRNVLKIREPGGWCKITEEATASGPSARPGSPRRAFERPSTAAPGRCSLATP